METIDKRSNNTILAHSGNRTWPTAMKNKKLLLGNIHDKPISGLYRVTEIVLKSKISPAPFWSSQPERELGLTSLFTY